MFLISLLFPTFFQGSSIGRVLISFLLLVLLALFNISLLAVLKVYLLCVFCGRYLKHFEAIFTLGVLADRNQMFGGSGLSKTGAPMTG